MALATVCGYKELMENYNEDVDQMLLSKDPTFNLISPANVQFPVPGFQPPKQFVEEHFGPKSGTMQFLHGTTTLAFVYEPATNDDKGGIIVAADSRASSGQYVGSSTVMKILEISDHILATMAGGAADCQFWTRVLAKQAKLFELSNKEKISVAAASKLLANMMYNYKGMGLSVGSTVSGYDKRGPALYYVDNDGNRVKGKVYSVGSGCLNAYGILDTFVKPRMTDAEAIDVARRAIMAATHRDTGSGGYCNLYHIKPDGHQRHERLDVNELLYKFWDDNNRETFDPASLQ
jgi:20S proteasome subunit beta 5